MRIRLNLVISAASQPTLFRTLASEPAESRAAILKELALAGLLVGRGVRIAEPPAAEPHGQAESSPPAAHRAPVPAAKPKEPKAPKTPKATKPPAGDQPAAPGSALDIDGQLTGIDDLGLSL